MKQIVLILIIGLVLLVVTDGFVAAAAVAVVASLVVTYRAVRGMSHEELVPKPTVQDVVARYGEPDDVITVDATRGNELEGIVMVYSAGRFLIVGGQRVEMGNITDVTFNNAATPYTFDDYQVVLTTTGEPRYLRVHVGCDAALAQEIVDSIRRCLVP